VLPAGPGWRDPVDFYATHAARFDAERSRALFERDWLDAFLALIPPGGTVLDLGCGMGEPNAAHMLDRGYRVTGVDATCALLDLARTRFPQGEWIEADMRGLDLGRRFDGILAWDSFFHLGIEEQRACFATFAGHAAPGAALMFTSGTGHGEIANPCFGEPLFHASLAPDEYRARLAAHGFQVVRHVEGDAACGGRTIWLAKAHD
jgi:predicted TPR repeat methyltransferase